MTTESFIRIRLLTLILFIFLVNLLAMKFFWYISIWWFDMPMHFLGGVWLGFLYIWIGHITKHSFFTKPSNILLRRTVIPFIVFVFAIGFAWELYEIGVAHITLGNLGTPLDSVSDLFFDIAGGLLAYILVLRNVWVNQQSTV